MQRLFCSLQLFMRNRYFSPQSHPQFDILRKQRQLRSQRSIGSAKSTSPQHLWKQTNEVRIGKFIYFKNRILGSGYSSKVYVGKKMGDSETLFAVKVINFKFFKPTNIQMLQNQIEIIKNLNHPNVLKCYEIIKSKTHCFIITEYCPNGDLHSYMNKRGIISQQKAVMILNQVIKGYRYLSKMNVIHRDLKPANILRSGGTWKIADFGFAIVSSQSIQSKANVGTPLYMPPESLIDNIYSTKSDIFSLGIILYEMLTGTTPWESKSQKDLIKKMKKQQLEFPMRLRISQNVKKLIEKMCDVNYDARMNQQEFLNFNLHKILYEKEIQSNKGRTDIFRQNQSTILEKKQNMKKYGHKSVEILSLKYNVLNPTLPDTEQEEEYTIKKLEIKNNHILINQLHYCRFLYYFIRNRNYMLLDSRTSEKVVLVIFRHLISLISQLSDCEHNWLNLDHWEKFIGSERYSNTLSTIKEYKSRYNKEYINYVKTLDDQLISEIDSQFGTCNKNINILTVEHYSKVLSLILSALKGFCNIMGIILNQQDFEYGSEEAGQIEALKFLYRYYQLINLGLISESNYIYFEAHSEIKVHVDYKNSGVTQQQYFDLANKILKLE